MKLITATLAVALITLFPIKTQAYAGMEPTGREATCMIPADMHQALAAQGLFLFTYGVTNDQFLMAIYASADGVVLLAESPEISCILTDGIMLYTVRERGI
jgi:hypothetical protein